MSKAKGKQCGNCECWKQRENDTKGVCDHLITETTSQGISVQEKVTTQYDTCDKFKSKR